MKKDDIVGGVLLLIAILGIGTFFFFAKPAPELSYGPIEVAGSSIAATAVGDAEVDIIAAVQRSGFVSIHESVGGAPGPIIGYSGLISVGSNVSVTILTSQLMTPGLPYVALLHVDNGDGTFIIKDDMPVTSNGVSVRADFNAPAVKETVK